MSDIGSCHVSSAAHLCLTSPSLWADGIRVFSLVDTAAFWMPYTILEHCISQWCRTFLILGDISERYNRQHGVAAIRLLRGVFATAPRFLPRTVHAAAQGVSGFFGLDFEASALQPHRMYLATKSGTIGKVSWGHYNGVSGRVHCRAFAWYMGRSPERELLHKQAQAAVAIRIASFLEHHVSLGANSAHRMCWLVHKACPETFRKTGPLGPRH